MNGVFEVLVFGKMLTLHLKMSRNVTGQASQVRLDCCMQLRESLSLRLISQGRGEADRHRCLPRSEFGRYLYVEAATPEQDNRR